MGHVSLETSDVDMNVLRHKMLKRAGWFVPKFHSKHAKEMAEEEKALKEICSSWLHENFHMNGKINNIEILEQEEIDRGLGLIGIRFWFSNGEGFEGESVAFVDAEEVMEIL